MAKGKDGYKNAGIAFFDVSGYSKLEYIELKAFHTNIWPVLAKIINKQKKDNTLYLYKKTWGDGIVLIHENHYALTLVALALRDYFVGGDYQLDSNKIIGRNGKVLLPRIALHFGEIQHIYDPIEERASYFGKEIVLPARIEPIIEPGHVWATYNATKHIWERQQREDIGQVAWTYCGKKTLVKGFGETHIWEILKKGEISKITKKEGITEEPKIPVKKSQGLGGQEPEAHRPIDPITARRIMSLTGQDPVAEKVDICSTRRDEQLCPAKAPSLRLIADIKRNGESGAEEVLVSSYIRDIRACAENVLTKYQTKQLTEYDLLVFNLAIKSFLDLFPRFERPYGKQTWSNKYKKAFEFLRWRKIGPSYEEWTELLFNAFKEIRRSLAQSSLIVNDQFNPTAVSAAFINNMKHIQGKVPMFELYLRDVGVKRIENMRDAIVHGFTGFSRFTLAKCLAKTCDFLFEKDRSVPPNWDKGGYIY